MHVLIFYLTILTLDMLLLLHYLLHHGFFILVPVLHYTVAHRNSSIFSLSIVYLLCVSGNWQVYLQEILPEKNNNQLTATAMTCKCLTTIFVPGTS